MCLCRPGGKAFACEGRMQPIDAGIAILVLHGLLGLFDSVFHREWSARLMRQPHAAAELKLHAGRAVLYVPVFLGLAWFEWHGATLAVLAGLVIGEFTLALAASVAREETRTVPATERAAHMVLGFSTGAWAGFVFFTGLSDWALQPAALSATGYGVVSWLLTAYALVFSLAAVRDSLAAGRLERQARYLPPVERGPRQPALIGE
jgi:uncharacterized protein